MQATISLVDLPTSRSQFYHEREARTVDFLFCGKSERESESFRAGTPGGHSHTLPIRACAAQRGRDYDSPDLERGIHFRGVF